MIIFFFRISLFFIFFDLSAEEKILECKINQEIENNKTTIKKAYITKPLEIFLYKRKSWMNDINYNDWKKEFNNEFSRINFKFEETEKLFFFEYKFYYTEEKRIIESSSVIILEKVSGYLKFIKYYYNSNGKIFFSSEVRGNCFEK